jgi:hypothetical protein
MANRITFDLPLGESAKQTPPVAPFHVQPERKAAVNEKTRDCTFAGKRYQIGRMSPTDAIMVHGHLVNVSFGIAVKFSQAGNSNGNGSAPSQAKPPEEVQKLAEGTVRELWHLAASYISEETYKSTQNIALKACKYYDEATSATMQVRLADGRWAAPGLEDDAVSVGQLITEAVVFNISPFFVSGLTEKSAAS